MIHQYEVELDVLVVDLDGDVQQTRDAFVI